MKIGIANDMPLAVEALRRALAAVPKYKIVWVAENGAKAVEWCAREKPDLVLMDLIMPGMDGVEATRRIMAGTPCPILLITVSVEANSSRVFEALGHGALDVLDAPALKSGDSQAVAASLLAKISMIEKFISNRHPSRGASIRRTPAARHKLLALGASAGGPAALATVLGGLPQNFPAAIVIVQHIDEQFMPHMATWLGQQCALPVQLAKEGDHLKPGVVLLAGAGDHLVFKTADRVGYTAVPEHYIYRPSIDVFFQSISRFWEGEAVGVLLTGMGRDGALGLKALRRKGYYTIAQDKTSSAVFGMPKAAAALDAAVDILPLESIAPRLVDTFTRKG